MSMFYGASPIIFERARGLRLDMTEAENILWERLSKNQLDNHRFRRQHPLAGFITDFYCHKAKLVIEIDGAIQQQIHQDSDRTSELNALGITVIRFTNQQIKENIEEVLQEIQNHLKSKSPLQGI